MPVPPPPVATRPNWPSSLASHFPARRDWSAHTPSFQTDGGGAAGSAQQQRTLFESWTWWMLNIDPLRCRQWEARRTVERRVTFETEIRGCIMLSRSLPCLWITLYIRLGCFWGSGDAQNAKEGKLVKFADKVKDRARQVRMWTA